MLLAVAVAVDPALAAAVDEEAVERAERAAAADEETREIGGRIGMASSADGSSFFAVLVVTLEEEEVVLPGRQSGQMACAASISRKLRGKVCTDQRRDKRG